jgi:hypothetical protein
LLHTKSRKSHADAGHSQSNWLVGLLSAVWLAAAVGGLAVVWQHQNGPGAPANAQPRWPIETPLTRATDGPTLVLLAHPQCSCTRASLGELAEALARATTKPRTYVVFLKPSSMPDGWEQTDLWQIAAALPDTIVVKDDNGLEAQRFGAATSGQTFLYDARGVLLFSGGITGSRGHAGDNAGRSSIVALLNRQPASRAATNVFGCSLFASAKS